MTRTWPVMSGSSLFERMESIDAKIDGDRNAQRVAAIGAHGMQQERGKYEQQAGPWFDGLGASRRKSALAGEFEHGRVHHRRGAPRVHHFELAAIFRMVEATAVVDVVGGGPERAGVIVAGVGAVGLIDVRPGLHDPIRLDWGAISVARQ